MRRLRHLLRRQARPDPGHEAEVAASGAAIYLFLALLVGYGSEAVHAACAARRAVHAPVRVPRAVRGPERSLLLPRETYQLWRLETR